MKIAIKRLRSSDLSLFQAYFKTHKSAKQKGFNLNKNVLEGEFFPGLTKILQTKEKFAELVDVELRGPNAASVLPLARKVKIDGKNFRLNGEVIPNPVSETRRFNDIAAGDFAVMEFIGNGTPKLVKLVLVSADKALDRSLHNELSRLFPKGSMRAVNAREISNVIAGANPRTNHPIRQWENAPLIEEAVLGSTDDIEELHERTKRARTPIDLATLRKARFAAEKAGINGEKLLNDFMAAKKYPGANAHEWIAATDPLSPFDFLIRSKNSKLRHVDAKSTPGAFGNRIYLSTAEIRHALSSPIPYDIARLYEVTEYKGRLRIARDIGKNLAPLKVALEGFPPEVSCDALSFDPSFFDFEPNERSIGTFSDDEDEDESDGA